MTTAAKHFVTQVTMSLVRMCTMTMSLVRVCMCMCLRARERERRERSAPNEGVSRLSEMDVPNSTCCLKKAEQERTMRTDISQLSKDSNPMEINRALPITKDELESTVGPFSPKRVAEECNGGIQDKIIQRRFRMGLRWLLKNFVEQDQDVPVCDDADVFPQSDEPQVVFREPKVGNAELLRRSIRSEIPPCTIAWAAIGSCLVDVEKQEQTAEERLQVDIEGQEDGKPRTPGDDEFDTHSSLCGDEECLTELRSVCYCSPLPNQILPSQTTGYTLATRCDTLQESDADLVTCEILRCTDIVESDKLYCI